MFFSNANRDIVKAQNPSLSFTDIAREIGSRWAGLSATDRRPYATLAQQVLYNVLYCIHFLTYCTSPQLQVLTHLFTSSLFLRT